MTAAARLDAESLSNRSPTSGKALSWFWSVCYNPINETVDFIFGLSIRGEWESVGVGWSVLGLAREDLSCPEIEISDSSILKMTAAARLDAESLSNRSPTSGENGKVWELGGVWCVEFDNQQEKSGIKAEFPE
ncbi:hypothetical protein YC2023_076599 [Brassica napus]